MNPTTTTAPWWYVAALAGAFALLGGLLSIAGTAYVDLRRFRRDRAQKWDNEVWATSVRLLNHVDEARAHLKSARILLASTTAVTPTVRSRELESARSSIGRAQSERNDARQEEMLLRFIATSDTSDDAKQLLDVLSQAFNDPSPLTDKEWWDRLHDKRRGFLNSVRLSLGRDALRDLQNPAPPSEPPP
ncbi:hypothetical protein ACFVU2_19035 [Leifsonia sp. NPDC058194]|uniref:hypothetical protein n=1 Tax=Leifsonia sp. NPDC058194 TaxID=3346374 RepID=UPI0036DB017C